MTALPPDLRTAIQDVLDGRSRRDLAGRALAASAGYRVGIGSAGLIRDEADVAAYLTARMPATFAAVAAALREARRAAPDLAPRSLLDAACGPGTASFAAVEDWPTIECVTLLDANPAFLDAARQLTGASPVPALQIAEVHKAHLDRDATRLPGADLVVMAYALVEMPLDEVASVAARLWAACREMLLLVEPGSREGFERIRRCRDMLVGQGASVVAPCTHEAPCPMAPPDWCHFSQRLPRLRDHMIAKGATVPFEDEKFSYVALARRPAAARRWGRVLAPPRVSKAAWAAPVCAEGAIARVDVLRRDPLYRDLKKTGWGDAMQAAPKLRADNA
ncbi:MAG: hypothetical protein INR70_05380 [Parafilimonas terrae]|nr:hypothetical protein [Parafilimonas terrae]